MEKGESNQEMTKPTIAIIGGGFGGICAAIQLQKQLNIHSFTIFDENQDFGGTWLKNKYPGAACDVESALYSFSFELNPNWSKNYASQAEIHAYIVGVAEKYNLRPHARFSTQVTSLAWKTDRGKWMVQYLDKVHQTITTTEFDYTIWAVGSLRVPKVPPEFKRFKGQLVHSAEWDTKIDLRGKRVGVIGSGASAVQIIPSIAKSVKELHSYQRSPTWVFDQLQFDVPAFIQSLFTVIPLLMWVFRLICFFMHELLFIGFSPGSWLNSFATRWTRNLIQRKVLDPETQKKLMPDYQLGCKRILFHNSYYSTFNRPNVYLHRGKITKVEGDTIETIEGSAHQLDVLILATGFDVQNFFAPLQVKGHGGCNDLLSQWKKDGPKTFYGIMSHSAPNSFLIAGAHSVLAHSSVIFMIECQCNFIVQVIREAISRKVKSVAVKKSVQDSWLKEMTEDMKNVIFQTSSCTSWYKNDRGEVTILWPKSCISYLKETRKINFLNFDWMYE